MMGYPNAGGNTMQQQQQPDIIPLSEEDLHDLYLWVDGIPISRPKRNIARDFSDGCCVAEIVKHYFPKLVEIHNFQPANGMTGKVANWDTLNNRVFRKLYFEVPREEIRDISAAVPGAIERFLRALRTKITQILQKQQQQQQEQQGQQHHRPTSAYAQHPSGSSRPKSGTASSSAPHGGNHNTSESEVEHLHALLFEKDRTIAELQEAVSILTDKVVKLEELASAKDDKIHALKKQQRK